LQEEYNKAIPTILHEHLDSQLGQIVKAYGTSYQDIPKGKENKEGNIKHYYFESDKESSFSEKALDKLLITIKELQESGYKADDIAILVRRAKEGVMVADKLMEAKSLNTDKNIVYDFISNDSLYLKNSSAIKLITNAINSLLYPDNEIYKSVLVYEYLFYQDESADRCNYTYDDLPKDYLENIDSLRRMPLYELSENIIKIFKLSESTYFFPYLQAFQDMLADYCNQNGSDISLFMDWWDEHKDKKVISVSENQEAIKILTIHKSKGLEFKAVIIPFMEWKLNDESMGGILWSEPKDDDFKALDVLPVKYGKALEDSIFYEDYYVEKLKRYIDSLNLLYVAFTRAENELISYSPLPKDGKLSKLSKISDLLFFIYKESESFASYDKDKYFADLKLSWNDEDSCFELQGEEKSTIKHENNTQAIVPLEKYTSELLGDRLKHRFHSEEYFDFDEKEDLNEFAPISRGNLIHSVFENIININDVDSAISKLVISGKISSKQSSSIKGEVCKLLENKAVKEWFSGEWEIMAERELMGSDGEILRPDRIMLKQDSAVVIDYKSGKEKMKIYNYKMKKYCKGVKALGYSKVKGYIWYLRDDTLEEVL
jgi:ATP-dependent exoDNAse (exonuclease V) beta subunit